MTVIGKGWKYQSGWRLEAVPPELSVHYELLIIRITLPSNAFKDDDDDDDAVIMTFTWDQRSGADVKNIFMWVQS